MVYIALGTNQGEREKNISKALELIREIPETEITKQSQIKEYEACEEAVGQPPFLNGAVEVDTELMPPDLLHKLKVIERKMGRETKGDKAQRIIDLDILSYGHEVYIEAKNLVVPHPRLHLRKFVLEPLVQINPDWRHPKLEKTSAELLAALEANESHQEPSPTQGNPSG